MCAILKWWAIGEKVSSDNQFQLKKTKSEKSHSSKKSPVHFVMYPKKLSELLKDSEKKEEKEEHPAKSRSVASVLEFTAAPVPDSE